jgi:hypothetical protein
MPSPDDVAEILTFRTPKRGFFQCDFEFLETVERRPVLKRKASIRAEMSSEALEKGRLRQGIANTRGQS